LAARSNICAEDTLKKIAEAKTLAKSSGLNMEAGRKLNAIPTV